MRRPLLLPLAPLYGLVTFLRNKFFDWGWLTSTEFEFPVLCIGNLSAGGTGKTPHTEWVLREFSDRYSIAVLSRGYGRKTKGFILANTHSTASEIGDEPLQLFSRFPKVTVAVCENRVEGIHNLHKKYGPFDLVVLDDAFQHRYAKAGLYWLLTPYDDLYTKDYILPVGNLRESRRSSSRADIITVTKCPPTLGEIEYSTLNQELSRKPDVLLSTSKMVYSPLTATRGIPMEAPSNALVVTGIANPKHLLHHVQSLGTHVEALTFSDHHHYTEKDVNMIREAFFQSQADCIITTRKDWMRWPKSEALSNLPTYVQDIEIELMHNAEEVRSQIEQFIQNYKE